MNKENRGHKSNNKDWNNRNLTSLADLFDSGFNLNEVNVQTEKVPKHKNRTLKRDDFVPPRHGPMTKTKILGRPIDLQTARALRLISIGYASQSFTTDWRKYFFKFRDPKSKLPYGLDASSPGPRALTLCVQCYIMKNLMFVSEKMEENTYFGKNSPKPNTVQQESALVDAFVDILWKVTSGANPRSHDKEKPQPVVTLVGESPCFETHTTFVVDGFTEKIWIYTLNSKKELRTFVRRNINYFCTRAFPGGVMLLYSIILSRTFEQIKREMGKKQDCLLTENARTTQALINLMLAGNAAPCVHNGVVRCDNKGSVLKHPLNGIRSRSEIGFLFFNKQENENKRTHVGSMFKTPLIPIWMTSVNGTYGLIFCTSRDLVTDWKTERYFCLHYYNGHFTQQNETCITIDTRTKVEGIDPDRQINIWDDEEEKEKKQPSLELMLFTKWPEANLDWNGETPYY